MSSFEKTKMESSHSAKIKDQICNLARQIAAEFFLGYSLKDVLRIKVV